MSDPRADNQLWLVGAPGTKRVDRVADVALRLPHFTSFTYAVPEALFDRTRPGSLVSAPYGRSRRPVEGWVVRVSEAPWTHTRKELLDAADHTCPIIEPLLPLATWISEYYHCPLATAIDSLAPVALQRPPRETLFAERSPAAVSGRLTPRQTQLLDALASGARPVTELLAAAGATRAVLNALVRRGAVSISARRATPSHVEIESPPPPPETPEDGFQLTAAQRAALDRIQACADEGAFSVCLLFGIPGSGKTEVYVRAIRAANARGRQAIFLVPEIALATQIIERLARRFSRVGVLHSQLTDRQRVDTLQRIAAGRVDVVIGARTAVFAPCPRLGLIVVDEEQESSFKNLAAPYFHARDVAIKRGHLEGVPVVLGSATPSLETWWNAGNLPHYHLCRLEERVPGARLPRVELLATELPELGHAPALISAPLERELAETLERGEQAILLHNRRGFSAMLRCQRCGLALTCPQCGTALIYHRAGEMMKCHRCGRRTEARRTCIDDTCGGQLERVGLGVQRLEADLTRRFPAARLLRLDSDSMRRRQDYVDALREFGSGAADVLIGTQMVAKGLDFPNVRLVGVVDADSALHIPDLRARERLFQLLVQVAGRAGRRAGDSLAVFQTQNPELDLFQFARNLDYQSFSEVELNARRDAADPPFTRLTRIVLADPRTSRVRSEAERMQSALKALAARIHADIRVEGPQPCIISRLRDRYRWQILIRSPRMAGTRLLDQAEIEGLLRPKVDRVMVDVDPVELM